MTHIDTMRLALDALTTCETEGNEVRYSTYDIELVTDAITDLTAAIAQQSVLAEPSEPVAWVFTPNNELLWPNEVESKNPLAISDYVPLYTHPPVHQPLSDEEIRGAVARGWCTDRNMHKMFDPEIALDIADAVLEAIRSKG
jgi:hypothetical protein